MKEIDVNCDMGESFGVYGLGRDEEVIQYVSSANIACGWHAGDPIVMDKTVKMAVAHGVGVGAHPGYPDLQGFGRRKMDCTSGEIRNYVMYQIGALMAFCSAHGVKMQHVKPHGSLYNAAAEDHSVATAVAEAIARVDSTLFYVTLAGPKGELMTEVAQKVGVRVMYEAFPDRNYTPEGLLVSRRRHDAVITDPEQVAARALMVAMESRIQAVDGSSMVLKADTLCVHGDNVHALEIVKNINELLESQGVTVRAMSVGAGEEGRTFFKKGPPLTPLQKLLCTVCFLPSRDRKPKSTRCQELFSRGPPGTSPKNVKPIQLIRPGFI